MGRLRIWGFMKPKVRPANSKPSTAGALSSRPREWSTSLCYSSENLTNKVVHVPFQGSGVTRQPANQPNMRGGIRWKVLGKMGGPTDQQSPKNLTNPLMGFNIPLV